MGDRVNFGRYMCVNCNLCVKTLRKFKVLELDAGVAAVVCSWVHPVIVTEDDYICEACHDIATGEVKQEPPDSGDQPPRQRPRGYKCVCVLCGCSLLNKRRTIILKDDTSELQQYIIDSIVSKVAPRQILASDVVCHACWQRTQRDACKMNLLDKPRSHTLAADDPPISTQSESDCKPKMEAIELPNYRRAPNSRHRCVFPKCGSDSLRTVPDIIRAIVLSCHHYYLPKRARVCDNHFSNNSWDTLYDSENSINTFTTEQIERVFICE